jgi:hypothetical protein
MLKRLTFAHLAIALAAAIVIACGSEQALLVSPRIDGAPPLGVVASPNGARVRPVKWQSTLASDQSWSFDVGPEGTTVRYPSVGLTITVPEGAVSSSTRVTVTALQGDALAYRFEPHGLQFAVPLQLTQSLRSIQVDRKSLGTPSLFAGYFAGNSLAVDAVSGDANVSEILPVQIDVEGHSVVLQIHHFSGYTVASAAADSAMDSR